MIIMDNMRSHHAKAVKAFLDERKVAYLYLPPYSLDLNPIEKLCEVYPMSRRILNFRG